MQFVSQLCRETIAVRVAKDANGVTQMAFVSEGASRSIPLFKSDAEIKEAMIKYLQECASDDDEVCQYGKLSTTEGGVVADAGQVLAFCAKFGRAVVACLDAINLEHRHSEIPYAKWYLKGERDLESAFGRAVQILVCEYIMRENYTCGTNPWFRVVAFDY